MTSGITSVKALRLTQHLLTGVVILLTIVLIAMLVPPMERQMDRWGLMPRHETMTEVYVPDADKVPSKYKDGKAQNVDFAIRNLEGKKTTYKYTITATKENGRVVMELKKGSITLNQGEMSNIHEQVTIRDMGKRVHLEVKLSNGQSIGYWVTQE
jgi:hypothetical protein